MVKPTLANLLLWRTVYIYQGHIYVDAIRVGLFEQQVFEGASVALFNPEKHVSTLDKKSVLYADIQRFMRFSDGYIAFDPERENILGDIRYSMLPTSTRPLWGIQIDRDHPGQHADYRFFRNNSQAIRRDFIALLSGRCDEPNCK